MSFDLTLQADFATDGRRGNLDFKTFAGKDLKTGEHADLTSEAESFVKVKREELEEKGCEVGAGPASAGAAESFVKVKLEELEEKEELEDKGCEVGAGPASAGAPAAPANPAVPVDAAAAEPLQQCEAPEPLQRSCCCGAAEAPVQRPVQPVSAVARPLKRRRPEPTREDLRRWEAMVKDAFRIPNHPRVLEFIGHFQSAARMDRPRKAREILITRAPEPGRQWMTLTHVEHWSWGCKDRFNRMYLEDLHLRALGSRMVYTFWNRPAMLEGQRLMELDHAFKNLNLEDGWSSESSDEEAQ